MKRTLIWCHGGCFSGGSVEYDKELREHLSQVCVVTPVNFSLNSWNEAIKDIKNVATKGNVILGGISSGGLLAHHVANQLNLPAVLICPVIKPATRHNNLSENMKRQQLEFFGTLKYMQEIEDSVKEPNNTRYILYGVNDTRAPYSGFSSWANLDHVVIDSLNKGHEICSDPPCELILSRIKELFHL